MRAPLGIAQEAPPLRRSVSRTLLRRLSVPSTFLDHRSDRGGPQQFHSPPPGSPPVVLEERAQPELQRRRARGAQQTALATLVCTLLTVALFVTDALGLTAKVYVAWDEARGLVRRLRDRWAEQLAAGSSIRRKLSSAALDAMGRGVSRAERVTGLLRRAVSLESKLDTMGAIRAYQAASDLEPNQTEPLLGLAKCISDRGAPRVLARRSPSTADSSDVPSPPAWPVFEPAIFNNGELARSLATQATQLSERALKLTPQNARAHLTSAVTLGRLALWSSNQRKIEISREVRERVVAALTLSPDDDVALHVLGRWEYEMAVLGWAVRMVVKTIYGGLEVGSLAEAHRCLARAIEINPERLVHRVVMARILLKQNKRDEAVAQLEAACRLPIEDVNAVHERAEALRMLAALGKRPPSDTTSEPRMAGHAAFA